MDGYTLTLVIIGAATVAWMFVKLVDKLVAFIQENKNRPIRPRRRRDGRARARHAHRHTRVPGL